MIKFEPHELSFLYKMLLVVAPIAIAIVSYLFIIFNKKIDKLEKTVTKHFDKLDTRLKKEEDKNKEFRHGHYKMDETISAWMDNMVADIKAIIKRVRKTENDIVEIKTIEHLKE